MSSGKTEVWSDGIYQYPLSAYKVLCDVRVQLSLFALLADCMIPLYCLLTFSLKNKQTIYCSLEQDRQCFLHPIMSQKGIHSGTLIFTLMLIITTVRLFYEQSFSLMLLLKYYICYLLCIVKTYFIYDIFFPLTVHFVPRQKYFGIRGRLVVFHSLSQGTIHFFLPT